MSETTQDTPANEAQTDEATLGGTTSSAAAATENTPTDDAVAGEPGWPTTASDGAAAVAGAADDATDGDDVEGGDVDGDDAVGDDAEASEGAEAAPAGLSKRKKALFNEGEIAADFLETLLDIADLDGDIDVDVDGDRAAVAIVDSDEGRVSRRLVGDNGVVLEALQELARLAVQAETGERSRLMLDVAGHRAARREELVAIAKKAIASVKETGEKVALDPMSAFERKVVHDEVAAAGLESESEGVEPRRHIVILPA